MAGLCIGVTYPLVDDRLLAVGPTPSSSVLDYQLLALVFDGGGLYQMLLGLLFFVSSLFQLILASMDRQQFLTGTPSSKEEFVFGYSCIASLKSFGDGS
ncbi:hypothetical protein F2Q70_00015157 [Brassica cretica]|uniref:Uncharacterized protein n=1 Tax=Brassica cretica TaxID=69181 RepID=A0A8S9HWC9_BRACR|nr:hypothetical protein F2Q70_00015157 [Brassica cretica]